VTWQESIDIRNQDLTPKMDIKMSSKNLEWIVNQLNLKEEEKNLNTSEDNIYSPGSISNMDSFTLNNKE
jgi:hypothetical protein